MHVLRLDAVVWVWALQGYLAHTKLPPSPGHSYGPRHRPTVGSRGGAISYERGAPVGQAAVGRARHSCVEFISKHD